MMAVICGTCNFRFKTYDEFEAHREECAMQGSNMKGNTISRAKVIGAEPSYSHSDWEALLDSTVEKIRSLAKLKGGEYAGDVDRLANFRRNGRDMELPMETIWRVYAGKHWDALTQYIIDIQNDTTRPRAEPISGRADDLIVYLILLKAMIEERGA